MRAACLPFVLLFVLSLRLATAGEDDRRASPDSDSGSSPDPVTDLIIDGPNPPLRLRVVVRCDGQAWKRHAAATNLRREQTLFEQLDSDGDGALTEREAGRCLEPARPQHNTGKAELAGRGTMLRGDSEFGLQLRRIVIRCHQINISCLDLGQE